jgi:dolichyl-phosphate beta-glucosyltransferase
MVAHDPAPQRAAPTFSLVLPTYNAAAFVEDTGLAVERFLERRAGEWEVLFVCDGCSDRSVELLLPLQSRNHGHIRVVSYVPNRGKGYAVRQGLLSARGRYRIFTDVDLAYNFEDVARVADTLQQGADVAIASRLHPDSRLVLPLALQGYAYRRHLQSLVFSSLVRRLLPLTQRDTQAGLKGLSARAAELVLPGLRCDGFGFDCELLVACQCHGLTVAEVPVTLRFENTASTTSIRSMRRMLGELWTIRRGWRRWRRAETQPPEAPRRHAA